MNENTETPTPTFRLEEEDLALAIKRVVYSKGEDHVGLKFKYVEMDNFGQTTDRCLVGEVLHELGVPDEELLPYNLTNVVRLSMDKVISIPDKWMIILRKAQYLQDLGKPWGEVYAKIMKDLERIK